MNFPPRHLLANLCLVSDSGLTPARCGARTPMRVGFLLLSFLLVATAPAAVMYGTFTNSNTGLGDTNYVKLIAVSGPTANADGTFTTIGLPIRVTPAANGSWTNSLTQGNWMATNAYLGRGIVFRVPLDHGATAHNIYSNLISGFNTYVTIVFGTNPPPTYDEVTSAVGFLPLTPLQSTNAAAQQAANATNTLNTYLQNTNSAIVTRLNATNTSILARIEATNLLTRAALTATNNILAAQIAAVASTNGASTATVSNISAYQASLVTNSLAANLASKLGTNEPAARVSSNVTNRWIADAALVTNSLAADLAGKLGTNAGAARVVLAVTNQWRADAALVTNSLSADLAGKMPTNNVLWLLQTNNANSLSNFSGQKVLSGIGTYLDAFKPAFIVSEDSGTVDAQKIGNPRGSLRRNSANNDWEEYSTLSAIEVTNTASLVTNSLAASLASKMNTNGALWRLSTNDASTVSNAVGLAPGSNITITTNANGRLWTIASTGGGGGGSQTPWTNDINGAGYDLTNADSGTFTNTLTVGIAGASHITATGRMRASAGGGQNNFVGGDDSLSLTASSDFDALLGGYINGIGQNSDNNGIVSGQYNSIGTGIAAAGQYSFIGGGYSNQIYEAGGAAQYSAIVGGRNNKVLGDYGFAAGFGAAVSNSGTFAWADSQGTVFGSTASDQFLVRAQGGAAINTNNPSGNALKVIGVTDSSKFTATNYTIGGNPIGILNTNNLAMTGAGTATANGTYTWAAIGGGVYTNTDKTSFITNISGVWYQKSADGTVNYSSATTPSNATWTIVSGSLPVPASTFGSYLNADGNVWMGVITSTNLSDRLAASTNVFARSRFTTNSDSATINGVNITNAAVIRAGSNITITTNANGRDWTLTVPASGANIANSSGIGTNTTIHTTLILTNAGVDKYRWMTWTNGILSLPAYNSDMAAGNSPAINFINTNGSYSAQIYVQADHGGADKPELILTSTSRVGIGEGYDGILGAGFIQLGRSAYTAGRVVVQYDDSTTFGWSDGLAGVGTPFLGHSKRLGFAARATNGVYSYPSIIGFAVTTNDAYGSASSYDGTLAAGELGFYSAPPVHVTGNGFTNTGLMVMKMGTNWLQVLGSNNITGTLNVGGDFNLTNYLTARDSSISVLQPVNSFNKQFTIYDVSVQPVLNVVPGGSIKFVTIGDNGNNPELGVKRNGSGYMMRLGYDNGNYIMSSTTATVGQPALTVGAPQQATNATLEVIGTTMSTRGYQYFDIGVFPTNAIPPGSATLTNFAMIAYKGFPRIVATNRATTAGWMEYTNGGWFAFLP